MAIELAVEEASKWMWDIRVQAWLYGLPTLGGAVFVKNGEWWGRYVYDDGKGRGEFGGSGGKQEDPLKQLEFMKSEVERMIAVHRKVEH